MLIKRVARQTGLREDLASLRSGQAAGTSIFPGEFLPDERKALRLPT